MNDVNIDLNLITYPLDMIKQLLGYKIYVKCRFNRELKGILHVIKIFIKFIFLGL
jgi:small nuclear ribonucleoprotein (snRNP)-like protein